MRLRGLALGHAGRGLVEQQQRGLGGQRAGELQPPLVAVGQVAGHARWPCRAAPRRSSSSPPRRHSPRSISAKRGRGRARPRSRGATRACMPDQHVLDRGHVGEQPDVLEGAAHAQRGDLVGPAADQRLAAEGDLAGVGLVETGEDVEQRRLAGAVGADDRRDPVVEREVDPVDGGQTAEALGDARAPRRARSRRRVPSTPAAGVGGPARAGAGAPGRCPAAGRSSSARG